MTDTFVDFARKRKREESKDEIQPKHIQTGKEQIKKIQPKTHIDFGGDSVMKKD